jgi:hypothetical protein
MKKIYDKILQRTNELAENQDSFSLPTIQNCEIIESDYSSGGATLYGKEYIIKSDEGSITVTYECKDKCRVFQINPDLNIVRIMYSGVDGNVIEQFSISWEDKN